MLPLSAEPLASSSEVPTHPNVDNPVFLTTLALGILFSVAYLIIQWRRKKSPDFLKVAALFLGVAGVISGAKLCYEVAFTSVRFQSISSEDKLTIFIGGLAVIWLAAIAIIDCFKKPPPSASPPSQS